jgi:hypothetical protein
MPETKESDTIGMKFLGMASCVQVRGFWPTQNSNAFDVESPATPRIFVPWHRMIRLTPLKEEGENG